MVYALKAIILLNVLISLPLHANALDASIENLTSQLSLDEPPPHTWERFVRKFRRDHHFALIGQYFRGYWHLNHVGESIDQKFNSVGQSYRFQYTFHLQIYKKFGYFLGSEIGYSVDQSKIDASYRPVDSLCFPGALIGIVYNFSPPHRILTQIGASLERFDDITFENPNSTERQSVSLHMTSFEWSTSYDYFFSLSWGLRGSYGKRLSYFDRPIGWEGKTIDISLKRQDDVYGIALIHHFL